MTRCEQVYWQLGLHHDGELDPRDCEAIERHLEQCSACGALREDLEDLARLCRGARRPVMPAEVRRRIEALLGSA